MIHRCILLLEDLDAAFTRSVSRDEKSTGIPDDSLSDKDSSKKDQPSDGSTLSLSGLLNALDGVAAAEGRFVYKLYCSQFRTHFNARNSRLLFATTNHIERLDPALSRPGRMDVWVNFTDATKWQAEGIFKCFFPSRSSKEKSEAEPSSPSEGGKPTNTGTHNVPGSKRKSTHRVPLLEEEELNELAKRCPFSRVSRKHFVYQRSRIDRDCFLFFMRAHSLLPQTGIFTRGHFGRV